MSKERDNFDLKEFVRDGVYKYDFSQLDLTVKDAIVAKCLDCYCYDITEAHNCECTTCPLYGLNKKYVPMKLKAKNKTERTEDQKEQLKKNLNHN